MGSPVAPGHSPHSLSLSLEFGGSRGIFPGIRDGGRGRVLVPSPWAPRSRACGSRWESPDLGRFNPKIPGWEPRAAFPERGRAGSGAGAPEPPPPGRHRRGRPAPTGASPAFPVGPEHPRHSRGNRSVLGIPAGSAPTGASPAFRGNRSDRSIPSGTGASSASPAFPVGPERPRHSRRIRSDRSIPGIPAGSPPTGGSAPLPPGLGSAAAPVPLPAMSSAPSPSREPPRYLSQAEAEAMEKELLEDYRFGRQQLIEIWGHACAVAVTKAFPLRSLRRRQPTLLVACGPAQNGAVGLVCARHLRSFVGLRAHHLLPQALPGPAAPRLHHAVREDGHPLPVLPAHRGAAHQRRLQRRGGRGAGRRGDTGDRGDRAVRGHPGHPQARPHPHRQPGCPLRLAARPGGWQR
ncbi:yjeF N-terminal domain-containing protein 3 isoform X3 [Zonotrichia albicollis]|uniref:yjeF N-terminal domain-containing protein 3 isoform X3 n=1 Tax=Zonotrichia albicollis TaxID=44394 RepID=UPI003D811157